MIIPFFDCFWNVNIYTNTFTYIVCIYAKPLGELSLVGLYPIPNFSSWNTKTTDKTGILRNNLNHLNNCLPILLHKHNYKLKKIFSYILASFPYILASGLICIEVKMLFPFKIISERVGPTWANHPFIPGSLWLVSSEGMFGVQCSILLQFTTTASQTKLSWVLQTCGSKNLNTSDRGKEGFKKSRQRISHNEGCE